MEPVAKGEEDQEGADGDQGRPEAHPTEVTNHAHRDHRLVGVDDRAGRRLTGDRRLVQDPLELHHGVARRVGQAGRAGNPVGDPVQSVRVVFQFRLAARGVGIQELVVDGTGETKVWVGQYIGRRLGLGISCLRGGQQPPRTHGPQASGVGDVSGYGG